MMGKRIHLRSIDDSSESGESSGSDSSKRVSKYFSICSSSKSLSSLAVDRAEESGKENTDQMLKN